MATWRERFRPRIAEALERTRGQPEKEIRRALREVWDASWLGPRRCWPYKAYLSEIRRQRGTEKPGPRKRKKETLEDERQLTLIGIHEESASSTSNT